MNLALVGIAALFLTYTACWRPNWFWAAFVSVPVLLELALHPAATGLPVATLGSLSLRPWDPSAFALLIGILYHGRNSPPLRRQPAGTIVGLIAAFLCVKILCTVLLGGGTIAANTVANSSAGSFVAAVGEVRDSLLAFIAPLYAIVCARHLRIERMTVPLLVATSIILGRALSEVARTGQIWTNDGSFRFIGANEALTLMFIGFLLFFLRHDRPRLPFLRSIACVAFAVSMVANHRSEWLAALAGISGLIVMAARGKLPLFVGGRRQPFFAWTLLLLLVSGTAVIGLAGSDFTVGAESRLLAFTDPDQDPTSSWRLRLWQARIAEVRDDWPWGRLLGDRPITFVHGEWLTVPNHNAYVTAFELGGVCLLSLEIALAVALAIEATKQARAMGPNSSSWAPAVALAILAGSLAFGVAYDFPPIGFALTTTLLLGKPRRSISSPVRPRHFLRVAIQPHSNKGIGQAQPSRF